MILRHHFGFILLSDQPDQNSEKPNTLKLYLNSSPYSVRVFLIPLMDEDLWYHKFVARVCKVIS